MEIVILVAHAYNLRYSGGTDRRITLRSQPGEIVRETLFQKQPSQKVAG
jgi:hypothetical protein